MKNISKHFIFALLICIGVIVGVSCSNDNHKKDRVLLLLKTLDNPFFDSIKKGVMDELGPDTDSMAVVIRAGTKESDISTQREVLNSFISQYVEATNKARLKGVILTPSASGDELTDYIKRLNDNNIPVVLVDTRINKASLIKADAHYETFIGSSNEDGGRLATDLMFKYLPEGGTILLLNGVEGHESAVARRKGFKSRLKEKQDKYKHSLIERTANWRRDEARKIVEGLLALGENVDGVFAANDEMALGAYEAMRTAPNRNNGKFPVIIGFDAIDPAVQAVKAGELTATIEQDPYGMGKTAVVSLKTIWAGGEVEHDQVIAVKAVEKDNQ